MLLLQWFGLRLWMRAETKSKQVIEVALLWPVVPVDRLGRRVPAEQAEAHPHLVR